MQKLRLSLGFFLGLSLLLAGGEFYARTWSPADVLEYLGEQSPLTGPYRPDPVLGADYASFEALRLSNAQRLGELGPLHSPQPTWLWFGNSFVQAPGMLGDMAAVSLPGVRMFYLKRNEPLHLRIAQARTLLGAGLKPDRIFFVVLPIDVTGYARRPLDSIVVTTKGAITYDIGNPPAPIDRLVSHSLLARTAWVREGGTNRAIPQPDVTASIPSSLASQLSVLMDVLMETATRFDVPVTLVLLPNREQVFGTAGFALQDLLTNIAVSKGFDLFDARGVFDRQNDKMKLFLPDWHFTTLANRDIFDALLSHLTSKGIRVPASLGATR
jgi:hypothetical protein